MRLIVSHQFTMQVGGLTHYLIIKSGARAPGFLISFWFARHSLAQPAH